MNNAASNRNRNIGAHVHHVQGIKIISGFMTMCLAAWQNTKIIIDRASSYAVESSVFAHRERKYVL